MKKLKLVIIAKLLFLAPVFSQELNKRINAGDSTILYFFDNIFFVPKEKYTNPYDTCDHWKEKFYINKFPLDKEFFVKLDLLPRHLRNDNTNMFTRKSSHQGYGTYEYIYDSNEGCVKEVGYIVDLKLPIMINGTEFRHGDYEDLANMLQNGKVLSVRRRKVLFGLDKICIMIE